MDDGVYIVNQNHEIEYINPVIERDFGKIEGRKCYEYLHCEPDVCSWCSIKDVFKGKSVKWEQYFDRTGKTYDLFNTPLINTDGSISALQIFHDITDRKKAEEKLKRQAALLDISYEAIFSWSLKEGILSWNNGAEKLYGYNNEESIGSISHELLKTRHPLEFNEFIENLIEKQIWTGELIHTTKDGKKIIVESRQQLIQDSSGKKIVIETNRDITERKKVETQKQELLERVQLSAEELEVSNEELQSITEELQAANEELQQQRNHLTYMNKALKESKEKYSLLFDKTTIPAALLSLPEAVIVDANDALEKLTGYTKQEMLGKTAPEIGVAKHEELERSISLFEKEGSLHNNETYLFTKSGEERVVIINTNPLKLSGQLYAVSTIQDITKRKRAEETLLRSEDQFKVLIRNLHSGIALIDDVGKFKIVNPSFMRMFNLDPKLDILNVNSQDWSQWKVQDEDKNLLHVDDHPVRKVAITGKPVKNQLVGVQNPGMDKLTWMMISAEPMPNNDGSGNMVICTYHDITERKKIEEEIQTNLKILNGINQIFEESLTCKTVENVVNKCLEVAEDLTDSEFSFIGEINENGRLDDRAISIQGWEACTASPERSGELLKDMEIVSYWGRTIKEEKSQIVNNPDSDPDSQGLPPGHPPINSFLGVPLKQGNETIGMIALANKKGGYTKDDAKNVEKLSFSFVESLMRKKAEINERKLLKQVQKFAEELELSNEKLQVSNEELQATTEEIQVANKKLLQQKNELKKAGDNLEEQVKERTEELERAYKSLKLANNYNRNLIETSLDPFVTIGPNGKITDVNTSTEQITGYSRDELIGTYFSNYFTEPRKAELGYQKAFKEGEVRDYELKIQHVNGHVTPVLYHASVYKDDDGEVIGIFASARDITDIKELIEDLKRSNRELQSFAHITSHDLQEPLRTIASFTQLLQRRYEGKFDSDADEFMDYVVNASARMKGMIQGLLEYSRIGAQGENFKAANIEEVLKNVLLNLRATINENNAVVTHEPLPTVIADKWQLNRLLQNIISNAIKFKKPDVPPKIHISAVNDEENNRYIFEVSDNGIGMEQQYVDQIFEIFKRLHSIDEYEGTGIGLAVVKRIVEHHGGNIWVESEIGIGSTFYFTLPKP